MFKSINCKYAIGEIRINPLRNIIFSLMGTYQIAIQSSKEGIGRCQKMIEILEAEPRMN